MSEHPVAKRSANPRILRSAFIAAFSVAVLWTHSVSAVTLQISSTSGKPGGVATFTVSILDTPGEAVITTSNVIRYDPKTAVGRVNGGPDCKPAVSGVQLSGIFDSSQPQVGIIVTGGSSKPCTGDCDNRRQVTVDTILKMVSIALGGTSISRCEAGDANLDDQIRTDEILLALNNGLNQCPQPSLSIRDGDGPLYSCNVHIDADAAAGTYDLTCANPQFLKGVDTPITGGTCENGAITVEP